MTTWFQQQHLSPMLLELVVSDIKKNQGTVFSRHVYLVQCQSLESLLLIPIPWFAALIVFTFQL